MSAIPAFLDALYARLKVASGLNGWQVFDGPPVQYADMSRVLIVGVSTEDQTIESNTRDAGLYARRETADVTCMARAWSGDDNLAARRTEVYAALSVVEAVLAADPTLGGAVKKARLASSMYTPGRDKNGTAAEVEFAIRIDDI